MNAFRTSVLVAAGLLLAAGIVLFVIGQPAEAVLVIGGALALLVPSTR